MLASKDAGVPVGYIDTVVTHKTISVKNYGGIPIPVQTHEVWGVLMCQSSILVDPCSSKISMTESKKTQGSWHQWYRAKAVNIFSRNFTVIIEDPNNKLKYSRCGQRTYKKHDPIIEPYHGGVSSVQIIYEVDFPRLGLVEPVGDGNFSQEE